MDLLIRSQNKMVLTRYTGLRIVVEQEGASIIDETNDYILGMYKTIDRALEVLDEIQNLIHQTFICKLNTPITRDDYERLKSGLACEYPDKEFMIQPPQYEFEPINSTVIIYEMPKE